VRQPAQGRRAERDPDRRDPLKIGLNGRFFPANWRPPDEEIAFALANGFEAIQIRVDPPNTIRETLRELPTTGGVEWVVELLVRYAWDVSASAALRTNLDALHELGVKRVHIHPVPGERDSALRDELAEALAIAEREGLTLGVEHNSSEHPLLVTPEECASLLDSLPGLGFVWDINHTIAEQVAGFAALKPRLTLVHCSDTPLPATNHHLPLGHGSVDISPIAHVDVPVILEIGGQVASGGYGKDTDEALIASRERLSRSG